MYLFFLTCVYWVASFQEWFFHKYWMHRKSYPLFDNLYRNHIAHHENTKKDYSMRNGKSDYICVEVFTTDGVIQIGFVFTLNVGFFYALDSFFGVGLPLISATVAGMLLVNVVVWNTIHPYVHGFDPYTVCSQGVSQKYLPKKNLVFEWLVDNHRKHHDHRDVHYNIVFPGADYVMGTHYIETPVQIKPSN